MFIPNANNSLRHQEELRGYQQSISQLEKAGGTEVEFELRVCEGPGETEERTVAHSRHNKETGEFLPSEEVQGMEPAQEEERLLD